LNKAGALFCINPVNKTIEKRMDFALNETPQRLCINSSYDTLYFINKHIYQMPVDANSLPVQELINGNNKNFYGLSIAPKTGYIYAADAIDYIQKGKIYSYTSNGSALSEFSVGLIPSKIYFK